MDEAGGDKRYYVTHDFLYSATAVIDSSGDLLERYHSAPYGAPTFWSASYTIHHPLSTHHCSFLFTGQRFDSETGLYHYKARAYSPTLGRFLQRHPRGYGDGADLYVYVGSRPPRKIDPRGLAETTFEITIKAKAEWGKVLGLGFFERLYRGSDQVRRRET